MKCFLSFHKWNGCVCARCGAKRNEQHDWNGCTCRRCGAKRDQGHDWNGCRCRICGKQRDKGHKYKYTPYDETRCKGTCKVCGAETLIAHHFEQAEGKCFTVCSRCHGKGAVSHRFRFVPERCVQVCEICGEETEKHSFVPIEGSYRGRCSVCGKEGIPDPTEEERKAIETLKNRDPAARKAAIDKLSHSYHGDVIAALQKAAGDQDPDVRKKALDGLFRIAEEMLDDAYVGTAYIAPALRDPDKRTVRRAARILGDPKRGDAVDPLIGVISAYRDGQDFSNADEAITALGKIGEAAVPTLLAKAEHGSRIRRYALRALAATASPTAFDALKEGLSDESLSEYDHQLIAQGLADMGTPEATEALAEALDTVRESKPLKVISEALSKAGKGISAETLEKKQREAEVRAAKALLKGLRSIKPGMSEVEADKLVGGGVFKMGNNVVHKTPYGDFQLLVSGDRVYDTLWTEGVIEKIEAFLKENGE